MSNCYYVSVYVILIDFEKYYGKYSTSYKLHYNTFYIWEKNIFYKIKYEKYQQHIFIQNKNPSKSYVMTT